MVILRRKLTPPKSKDGRTGFKFCDLVIGQCFTRDEIHKDKTLYVKTGPDSAVTRYADVPTFGFKPGEICFPYATSQPQTMLHKAHLENVQANTTSTFATIRILDAGSPSDDSARIQRVIANWGNRYGSRR